jgi:hypothetical protein
LGLFPVSKPVIESSEEGDSRPFKAGSNCSFRDKFVAKSDIFVKRDKIIHFSLASYKSFGRVCHPNKKGAWKTEAPFSGRGVTPPIP